MVVYVREAHPVGDFPIGANKKDGVIYTAPQTYEQRKEIAKACEVGLSLKIPIIVDKMDDAVERAYQGHPDRLYIVGEDGKLVYVGGKGPSYFWPKEAKKALDKYLREN